MAFTPQAVLALQRAAGNRATLAALALRAEQRPARVRSRCSDGVCTCGGTCTSPSWPYGDPDRVLQREPDGGTVAQAESAPPAVGTYTLPEITIVAVPPASLRSAIGSSDYYRKRRDDFLARNPGEIPPDYYMGYGDKYAHLFMTSLRPRLSKAGQTWLDCTFRALQTAMENERDANPWAFAEVERNNDAFRDFAYGTHEAAYIGCGICDLNILDETEITFTPDFTDSFFSGKGITQILDVFADCNAIWFYPQGPATSPTN